MSEPKQQAKSFEEFILRLGPEGTKALVGLVDGGMMLHTFKDGFMASLPDSSTLIMSWGEGTAGSYTFDNVEKAMDFVATGIMQGDRLALLIFQAALTDIIKDGGLGDIVNALTPPRTPAPDPDTNTTPKNTQ
jgi:hypothetical protein